MCKSAASEWSDCVGVRLNTIEAEAASMLARLTLSTLCRDAGFRARLARVASEFSEEIAFASTCDSRPDEVRAAWAVALSCLESQGVDVNALFDRLKEPSPSAENGDAALAAE